ncbi:MAG: 5-formyltetrahydrofolate cyclo-ligase [Planctomycetes bacterium]|nr:5-formyltetrahydrofolate cyclo-ligase [Planctomycetota bacterium]
MNEQNSQQKAEIRRAVLAKLAAMGDEQRHEGSVAACSRLTALEVFQHASVVMLYMPLASEVDLTPVAIRCFQTGKTVCVPLVDWKRRDMEPVEVTSFDDHVMEVDEHGLRMPRGGAPIPPDLLDLVVVPGLAFDAHGHRLGRGGGYYDRFLGRLRRTAATVGLGFDVQITDEVPVNDGDVSVDIVVTDRRVTHARGSRTRG